MDNFTKTQPKFTSVINNSKLLNKTSHAYLIEGNSSLVLDKAIKYLCASMLCSQAIPCFECEDCQRVIKKNNVDIMEFDLSEGALKKDAVLEIQKSFSKTAIEKTNKQIYIIKYIENSTSIALNSLLKFLEEPNENVYAIFTSSNLNRVLDTIVSRCSSLVLAAHDIDELKNIFYLNYDKEDVDLVTLMTNDEVYIEFVLNSTIYKDFKEDANKIFSSIFNTYFFLYMNEKLKDYDKDELSIFFELFYICLINREYLSYLGVSDKTIELLYTRLNYDVVLDVVLSSRLQLNTNMSKALLVDKFSIEIEESII